MRRRLGYRDAVVVLGGDPQALSALDSALAAALSLATGGLSGTVLGAFVHEATDEPWKRYERGKEGDAQE